MNRKNLKKMVMLAAVIALLVISGCGPVSPTARVGALQTRSEMVALDGDGMRQVEIDMAAGDLMVSGGASELMQADFVYNVADLEPQVAHSGSSLTVRTPNTTASARSLRDLVSYRNEWDVRLNDSVPMQVDVEVGAGSANLKLGGMSLTSLDLVTGAGPVTVDLTGSWQNDLEAEISVGLGGLTVRLPSDTCARVDVDGGLNPVDSQGLVKNGSQYASDACGKADTTLRIHIDGGVGVVQLAKVE